MQWTLKGFVRAPQVGSSQGEGAGGWGTHSTLVRLATSVMVEVNAGAPSNAYTGGGA